MSSRTTSEPPKPPSLMMLSAKITTIPVTTTPKSDGLSRRARTRVPSSVRPRLSA
jgi:hypothetical protein